MGVDSRGINRGECSHPECQCREFQRSSGASKCYVCSHPPASHKTLEAGNDKRTSPTPAAHHSTDSEFSGRLLAKGLTVAVSVWFKVCVSVWRARLDKSCSDRQT